MHDSALPPLLTAEEARVLGCLIEKSQATPEYYPLTLNALVLACNQKTSREPVVEYTETTVEEALAELRAKGLAATVTGGGRVIRHAHRAGENGLMLTAAEAALLSVALLRGPQTIGELRSRSARQHEFASLEDVEAVMATLQSRGLLEEVPRAPGQKESRFRHRFFRSDVDTAADAPGAESMRAPTIREDIEALRHELEELRRTVTAQGLQLGALLADLGHQPEEE